MGERRAIAFPETSTLLPSPSTTPLTTPIFRRSPSSSTPVPLPTTLSGGAPVRSAVSAAAEVVFPIPASPIARRSSPPNSATDSAPALIDASTSSTVIAGPIAIFWLPHPTFLSLTLGTPARPASTPTSTTPSLAPTPLLRGPITPLPARSEERRVGKERSSLETPGDQQKQRNTQS